MTNRALVKHMEEGIPLKAAGFKRIDFGKAQFLDGTGRKRKRDWPKPREPVFRFRSQRAHEPRVSKLRHSVDDRARMRQISNVYLSDQTAAVQTGRFKNSVTIEPDFLMPD